MARVNGLGQPQLQLPTLEPNVNVSINDAAAHNAGRAPRRRPPPGLDARLRPDGRQLLPAAGRVRCGRVEHPVGPGKHCRHAPAADRHRRAAGMSRCRASPTSASSRAPIDIRHEALSRYVDVTAPVYVGSVADAAVGDPAPSFRTLASRSTTTPRSLAGRRRTPTSHLKFLSFVLAAPDRHPAAAPGGVRQLATRGGCSCWRCRSPCRED